MEAHLQENLLSSMSMRAASRRFCKLSSVSVCLSLRRFSWGRPGNKTKDAWFLQFSNFTRLSILFWGTKKIHIISSSHIYHNCLLWSHSKNHPYVVTVAQPTSHRHGQSFNKITEVKTAGMDKNAVYCVMNDFYQGLHGGRLDGDVDGIQISLLNPLHPLDVHIQDAD